MSCVWQMSIQSIPVRETTTDYTYEQMYKRIETPAKHIISFGSGIKRTTISNLLMQKGDL